MNTNTVIDVSHISKKFSRDLSHLLRYGLTDIGKSVLGFNPHSEKLRSGEFWSVDDVSFSLKKGETLGIIGPNGSGKTTILKMLNGILSPDKGKIEIHGRVGPLIEVGAGFHPLLTGRENIYVNGAILGMSKKEIDAKFTSIVNFADIGHFIDSPVKTYSSGMFVRLGFAIAVHCNPKILLIDEILSVGDMSFQNKCLRQFAEVKKKMDTIIFISHNLEQVRNLCDQVLVMNQGKPVFLGKTDKAIIHYYKVVNTKSSVSMKINISKKFYNKNHSSEINFIEGGVLSKDKKKITTISYGDSIQLFLEFSVKKDIEKLYFSAGLIKDNGTVCVWKMSNDAETKILSQSIFRKGTYILTINLGKLFLNTGVYIPSFAIYNTKTKELYGKIYLDPLIISGDFISREAIIYPPTKWNIEQLD